MTKTVCCADARDNLEALMDETLSTLDPIRVTRPGKKDVVLFPADELSSIQETLYLIKSPANARRLYAALERARRGEGEVVTVEELRRRTGLTEE